MTAPPPHSTLETLFGQIQIAKAATYAEDAQRCEKMSTSRNACYENPEKKVFWEKSLFMYNPVYFFFIFNISGKSMKQELLEMVQVTAPFFLF